MKAINNYVIVEESKLGVRTSESGLEFAEALDDEVRYRRGTILDAGQFDNLFSKGDSILYDKHAGNGSPELPERCKIMQVRDIAVIL